jgi:hypothetical protein
VTDTELVLPEYAGANLRGIVPALLGPARTLDLPAWIPGPVHGAQQVVLLVLDGLGWEQLRARPHLAPTLCSMEGGAITSVVPSTTATALTSIATGLTPGEHGLIGYRIDLSGDILNVLRWSTPAGDARRRWVPRDVQPYEPFLGESVPVVSRMDLEHSAFTEAHLRGVRHASWRLMSNIPVVVRRLLGEGEPFVHVYYDGIDKTAHEHGLGAFFDAELVTVDRFVADLLSVLPTNAALLITADHGQVEVGERIVTPDPAVLALTRYQSGEGRFRWLHGRPGAAADLYDAAKAAHGDVAWVVSREEVLEERWFGPVVAPPIARRMGDVALVARDPISFDDPADTGPFRLVSRHGSLTSAEMLVPLLAGRSG